MPLKFVGKAGVGTSVTSYEFEYSDTDDAPAPPEPDPLIVEAIRAALEQSSYSAKALSQVQSTESPSQTPRTASANGGL